MKAFNLKTTTVTLPTGDKSVISLGEDGRGRKQSLILCPAGLQDGDPVSLNVPRLGRPSISTGNDPSGGWLARISTSGAYIRGANGNVRVLNGREKLVTPVAYGYGAFGAAGRTGTWQDWLLVLQEGAILRVKPSRGDAHFLVVLDNGVFHLSPAQADISDEPFSLEVGDYTTLSL